MMNTFQLEGHVVPRFNQTIEICGNVRDNCCTLYDQMKIVKMWKEYTRPVITHKVNQIVNLYQSIFAYHYYFTALPLESLPMYFTAERWVPHFRKVCDYSYAKVKPEKNFSEGLGGGAKTKWALHSGTRKLAQTLNDASNITLSDASPPHERSLLDEIPLFNSNLTSLTKVRALRTFERFLLDKNNEDSVKQIVLTKTEVAGLKKIQFIQKDFHQAVHRSLAKIIHNFSGKLNKLEALKAKLQEPLDEVKNELELAMSNPDYLHSVARKMAQLLPKDDVFNVSKLDQLYVNNQISDEQAKFKLTEKREDLEKMIDDINEQTKALLAFQEKFLKKKMKINFDNKEMATLVKLMARAGVPKLPEKHANVMRVRHMPDPITVQLGKFSCHVKQRQFYRKFYIINSKKFKYCDNVLWAIKKFDLVSFMRYLRNIKDTLDYMVSLRKSLYCALCDLNMQRYFNFKNQVVLFNEGFCHSYIIQFAEYFKWKDVLFIEYLNYLFQLIKCFETPGSSIDFPFSTMIDKYHKQVFFFKRCFDNMDTENRFKYCHFICKEFKYDSMTSFIEGDVKFLKDVHSLIFSFIRKQNVETSREVLNKLKTMRNIEIPQYHPIPTVMDDIEDMIKKEEDADYLAQKSTQPPQEPPKKTKTAPKKTTTTKKSTGRILEEAQSQDNDTEISLDGMKNKKMVEEIKRARELLVQAAAPTTSSVHSFASDNVLGHPLPLERRLSSDFLAKPIYKTREIKPVLDTLRPFFYSDFRGLNPMLLQSLTNFDFDLHDYLTQYVKKLSKETITVTVLNTALQTIPLEKTFNSDMNFEIKDGDGHPINPQSPAVSPNKVQMQKDALLAVYNNKDHLTEFFPTANSPATIGEYTREGLPELEYLMNQ